MTMHVVKEPKAQAGQDPDTDPTPRKKEDKDKKGPGALFWFILGIGGGAFAMHTLARKMQEYAGGVYAQGARARFAERMAQHNPGAYGAPPQGPVSVNLDDDDDDTGGGAAFFY